MKRKVLAVTGIRSEYDILKPVLRSLADTTEFAVRLAVSGAHLSDWHGFTLNRIKEDGFEIADCIDSLLTTDRKTQRAKGVGILTYALSQTVEREDPDFIIFVGDREESIASALVGNYMDVLVAHIGGGDSVYGNADDPVRFAVSKLAHIHFTIAQKYAENLRNIGEESFRIFNVGNPSLDTIGSVEMLDAEEVSRLLDFDVRDGNFIFLIQHPLSSEKDDAGMQMEITLRALKEFSRKTGFKVVASYPNTDPGSYAILNAIDNCKDEPFIKFFKTLPRELFVNVLRRTKSLAGNSSMGILEAPFYQLPVVNIGDRQKGRLNAGNVEFVPFDEETIIGALMKACFSDEYRAYVKALDNPFGQGKASENIRDVLMTIDPEDRKWLVKGGLC